MSQSRLSISLLSVALLLSVLGCKSGDRPPLGKVSGTVTIDGKPLVGADVAFMPETGRPASGVTDENGKYTIKYIGDVGGTKIGKNSVSISTPTGGKTNFPIPAKYLNIQTSELTAEVTAGSNTFDFDLQSESDGGAPPAATD